jgi:hypothetical protein
VTYSAVGLPSGITYDAVTGEIRGTSFDVGIYPVSFRAEDTDTGESLVLEMDFAVLPATGGEARDIAANVWVAKQILKTTGDPGRDKWKATFIYNADRRTGRTYDPAFDTLQLAVGSRVVRVDPGVLTKKSAAVMAGRFEDANGARVSVKVLVAKQMIKLATANDTLGITVPGTLRSTVIIGGRGYRLDEFVGESGKFVSTSGYRNTAFVVADGKLKVKGPGLDTAKLKLCLADPSFTIAEGEAFTVRVVSGEDVLLEKDAGPFLVIAPGKDPVTGATTYLLKNAVKDEAESDNLAKFVYDSGNGKMKLSLKGLDLSKLPTGEAHLGLAIEVGGKIHFTSVTFFETRPGSWTTKSAR